MEHADLVTVVIPAANEERTIGACLDSVTGQDYRTLQVVVVDGASTDATAAVVSSRMQADPRIELVVNPRRNIPASLNAGLAAARGRWLVRVDAHSTIAPSYVSKAVELLRTGEWGGVGGRKDAVGHTPAGRAIAVAMGSHLGVGNSTYHHGTEVQQVDHLPFGAYPTALLRELGGWDENLVANEDFELDYRIRRAGRRLLFDPAMWIAWECRQSIRDLYRQYDRYGKGKVDVARKHPTSLSPRHVAPPLFVGYLAAAGIVAVRRPRWAVSMIAPYAIAVTAESARSGSKLSRPGDRARLPAAFVAMHVGWGAGFLRRSAALLRDRSRSDLLSTGTVAG